MCLKGFINGVAKLICNGQPVLNRSGGRGGVGGFL